MPNSRVAAFDVAVPGSQPTFQAETLIPALRAALALDCEVQNTSRFDRKHYFWWDQPSGYQITQYYEPFAKDGRVTLKARDGIAKEDGEGVSVRIKQVQMEQDTGKTTAVPGGGQWIDFNRVGMPLVEVISEPDMRYPRTAAAFVKKVQGILGSVDACVSGMEMGGLRADVNVSVRRSGDEGAPLGTRTEIKNLSTIKAVEDAIIAERDRQIAVLEAGGTIAGETRGWTLGSKETRRLRGKEGEVDYRYMPDPDIPPLVVSPGLVEALRESVSALPDVEVDALVGEYGLSAKDAMSLMALEGGGRVEYFYNVVEPAAGTPGRWGGAEVVLRPRGELDPPRDGQVDVGKGGAGWGREPAEHLGGWAVRRSPRRGPRGAAAPCAWRADYGKGARSSCSCRCMTGTSRPGASRTRLRRMGFGLRSCRPTSTMRWRRRCWRGRRAC